MVFPTDAVVVTAVFSRHCFRPLKRLLAPSHTLHNRCGTHANTDPSWWAILVANVFSPITQLRQLEERLLDTISAVQGTILDDDTVVQALEDLKEEAGDVAKEVRRIILHRPLYRIP